MDLWAYIFWIILNHSSLSFLVSNSVKISVKCAELYNISFFSAQRLKRGISNTMNNVQIVNIARNLVLYGIKESGSSAPEQPQHDQQVTDALRYTFILPNINRYPDDFRAFLHKDLIETSTLVSLEQAGKCLKSKKSYRLQSGIGISLFRSEWVTCSCLFLSCNLIWRFCKDCF